MITKHIEKKIDDNYSKMLQGILNMFWKQHPMKQQMYGHLTPVSKTIQIRWSRYVGHHWRSKDKLSDTLLWTLSHGHASVGRLTRTYLQERWMIGTNGERVSRKSELKSELIIWWLLQHFFPTLYNHAIKIKHSFLISILKLFYTNTHFYTHGLKHCSMKMMTYHCYIPIIYGCVK